MERRLFEQLTLSSGAGRRRRGTSLPVSLAIHASVLGAVLIVPVLTPTDLPTPARSYEVLAGPAVLVPPPPPPRGVPPRSVDRQRHASASPATGSVALLPTSWSERPLPEGPGWDTVDLGECEGCVPWGVDGSIPGLAPASPDPAPPAPTVAISSDLRPPVKLRHVAPVYPALAREAGVEGVVVIECRLDTGGRVADTRVLQGHPLLDGAALEAVRQWRYRPTLLNGLPVSVILNVTVRFTLRR